MKQLALLALADAEVDLLTRLANRSDLTLTAVYHPDPHSLVARLAELAEVPVYTDLGELAELSLDGCLGGERSRTLADNLADRAVAVGRPAPMFISLDDADRFLDDPSGWTVPARAVAASEPESNVGTAVEEPPSPPADITAPNVEAAPGAEAAAEPPAAVEPSAVPAPPDPTPAPTSYATPAPPSTGRHALGAPTMDLLYDPARLAEWLARSALQFAGAESAVVWRREADGRRWTLMSFAPDPERLPAVTFPPEELEQHAREHGLHVAALGDADAGDPPVRALYLPLPGGEGPFGLLALFESWDAPDWDPSVREELAGRAMELGLALERCVQMSQVGQELKHLKFKERLRDLLLDDRYAPAERWRQCLEFLLVELPATAVWYFAADETDGRLHLVAATSVSGPIEGHLSLPIGAGLIGAAFGGEQRASWFCESADGGGEIVTVPVDAGRGGQKSPIGVLMIEGVPPAEDDAREAGRRVDQLRDILAPLVPTTGGE